MTQKINIALAAVLITVIFFFGIATAVTGARSIGYATFVTYTQYLSEGGGLFDQIRARVQSANSAINLRLFGKDFFQKANAQLQLSIGKEMLTYGSQTMVKLKGGQLYDIQPDADVTYDLDKMDALNQTLSERGIPMLFVYMHSELYEDGMLPDGIRDFNNKVADDVVNGLRGRGISVIDSRDVKAAHGLTIDEVAYRTDQHCAVPMDFALYGEIVNYLNDQLQWGIDAAITEKANFSVETIKEKHMNSVGQRVGPMYVKPDDFLIMKPLFDTAIHRRISAAKGFEETEGTFSEAVLNLELLEALERAPYANLYDVYGLHTEQVMYRNENAVDKKLLVVKDSFGTPVTSFLSLAVGDVMGVDVRKTQRAVESFAEEFQAEAVVIIHCQEMMRQGKNYVLVEG